MASAKTSRPSASVFMTSTVVPSCAVKISPGLAAAPETRFSAEGIRPTTLMDYLPDDFLMFIDESHMTVPQVGGMHNGNFSRKQTLIDHGFRLRKKFTVK